jgi:hypothetical protein
VKTSSDFSSVLFREHVAELKNSKAIRKSKHLTRADISFSEMPHVQILSCVSGGYHMKKLKSKIQEQSLLLVKPMAHGLYQNCWACASHHLVRALILVKLMA